MKVFKATETYLEEIIPLFDQYRVFYKQASNLEAARRFLKERFQKKRFCNIHCVRFEWDKLRVYSALSKFFFSVYATHLYTK